MTREEKRKGNRLRALITLASEDRKKDEACPYAEQMARLLDNLLPQEEREKLMLHVSSCNECYRSWLLSRTVENNGAEREQKTRKVRHIFGYAGTAVAAVASVVLFLNIQNMMGPSTTMAPPPPSATTADEKIMGDDAPVAGKNREKEFSSEVSSQEKTAEKIQIDISRPTAQPSYSRSYSDSTSIQIGSGSTPRTTGLRELEDYYETLHNACSSAAIEKQAWEEFYEWGRDYIERTSTQERYRGTEQIVLTLGDMIDYGDFTAGCQQIRALIMQDMMDKNKKTKAFR